jgi:DNA (cytosine-5)-methyltransferase 1|tara:strand:+ start:251 stop:1669 length:1419 start_codon:yes stop_codon:yes gene_type:complete
MVSIKEAASKLDLTPQQVRNLCRDAKIQADKVGRTWIISEEALKDYFSSTSAGIAEDQLFYGIGEVKREDKPIALSFFSGAMGMDLGLEKAGFQTLFASEIDNACRKTIVKNKPEMALVGDMREFSPEAVREIAGLREKEDIDLVVGGPPCQAFSTAGKRKAFDDDRGNVFLSFIDMIIALAPKYAVIENVRGLLSAPLKHRPHNMRGEKNEPLTVDELPGGALNEITSRLEKAGYAVTFNLYNAANFGTPQKRERVVIICSRDGKKAPYLEPTHSEDGSFGLKKWVTFKQAVKGLYNEDQEFIKFPEKRLKYYRLLNAGENWKSLPIELQKEAMGKSFYSGGGKTGFLRRLAWNKPSPTLVTHPAMPATDLSHPDEDRPLSVEEYKRLQEFPNNWHIEGSILDKYKQIGNAVPVGLGYAIGIHLLKLMNDKEIQNFEDFKYSRYNRTCDTKWRNEFEELIRKHKNELVSVS